MKKPAAVFLACLLWALLPGAWGAAAPPAVPCSASHVPRSATGSDGPDNQSWPQKRAAATDALKEVDELLKQASQITSLPIRHPVNSAIAGQQEIHSFIAERVKETTGSDRLHAQEMALKKFGLLPADFALGPSLISLLSEQAAAFYDPRRRQIFIADWTPISLQRPAIVHELTHALQDQQVGLDGFLEAPELNSDEQMARSAMVEGTAVLAMMEYMLSGAGLKPDALPNLDETMASATAAEINKFPAFAAAPLYLRETLLFPYTAGMQYVRALVRKQGKAAYLAALKNPPRSTAEVLHPDAPAPAVPTGLQPPDVPPLPPGYKLLDKDVLGELDVRILLKQYLGEKAAGQIAPGWRGLRFAVYENPQTGAAFLVHRSAWKDPQAAGSFAEAYRRILIAKGEKDARVEVSGATVAVWEGVAADPQPPGSRSRQP